MYILFFRKIGNVQILDRTHCRKMRNTFLSLLLISALCNHFDSCASGALNTDRLFKMFELACGKYQLCNIPQSNIYYHIELHRCPPCSCDETCFELNNCCPDMFFGAKYKVLTLSLDPPWIIVRTGTTCLKLLRTVLQNLVQASEQTASLRWLPRRLSGTHQWHL